ncbi:MAG: MFS transporter [Sphingomonas sp.]|nr:MFS transporter [Sphingomonas sp.]
MLTVSLGFFFVTATTFTSLGYVLYTMVAELGWSHAAAGASFALLGLACGLGSPLAPLLMKWVGTRMAMTIGGLVLASGFLLASVVNGLSLFFVATALMGIGFSLIATSPGVYLIATWLPERASRLIGFYFMAGAAGGIAGPLIVRTIVTLSGSWRMHWMVMGFAAISLAAIFFATVRDAVRIESAEQVKQAAHGRSAVTETSPWTAKQALLSSSFLAIALALLVVQTVITTMHSVLVAHIANFGMGSDLGAWAMSLLALSATLSKGLTGGLSERFDPKWLTVLGLIPMTLAMLILSVAAAPAWAIVASVVLGVGWGLAWVAPHILLLRYFGSSIAGELTAMATAATTLAVLGPLTAGWIADTTGSFVPVFMVFAGLVVLVTFTTIFFLRAPRLPDRAKGDVSLADGETPALALAD